MDKIAREELFKICTVAIRRCRFFYNINCVITAIGIFALLKLETNLNHPVKSLPLTNDAALQV